MSKFTTTIFSNVDPFSFRFDETNARLSPAEARWHSLLGSFYLLHVKNPSPTQGIDHENTSSPLEKFQKFIHEECRVSPALWSLKDIYSNLFPKNLKDRVTEDSVREAILQMAKGYYEQVWQSLTVDEQLALYHLAKDRYIHIEHPGLDPLLKKGLILFNPDLRLMNTSFREFVRRAGERDELNKVEEKSQSIWNALKFPVGLGLGTIIFLLIFTQEELRTALPAVISLVPLLLQGIPDLSKSKGTSS